MTRHRNVTLTLLLLLLSIGGWSSCGGTAAPSPKGSCSDGKKDGHETDVDCGGGTCAPCVVGDACVVAQDCTSNTCTGSVCRMPPQQCLDGTRNGGETDIDCGGGTCPACGDGKDCLFNSDCQSDWCSALHHCSTPPSQCGDGKKDGNESDIDCGGGTCAPCGNGLACDSASDCQSATCSSHVCMTPPSECTDGKLDGNETDIDCGGGTCAPCGDDKGCESPSDCQSNSCVAHVCSTPPSQCSDGTKDGNETDVDCGGGTCPACVNGKACAMGADCQSGACNQDVCGAPPSGCSDGKKDGTETAIDCGGSCPACANGKACASDGDCQSGVCQSLICAAPSAQCTDGIPDGNETDTDCGGGMCPACGNGKMCAQASDCQSGACIHQLCGAPPSGCSDGKKDGDETAIDCGGSCSPCANGKACNIGADCQSSVCTALVCAAPAATCSDDKKDGTETAVDCGGGACPACANGSNCSTGADCQSGLCNFSLCSEPLESTCTDGSKDGNESDVDCGGGACGGCVDGKHCAMDTDCLSGLCSDGLCAAPSAQCSDGKKDGNETDVDCGGGACPPCGFEKTCDMGGDCLSNFCDMGTCDPEED